LLSRQGSCRCICNHCQSQQPFPVAPLLHLALARYPHNNGTNAFPRQKQDGIPHQIKLNRYHPPRVLAHVRQIPHRAATRQPAHHVFPQSGIEDGIPHQIKLNRGRTEYLGRCDPDQCLIEGKRDEPADELQRDEGFGGVHIHASHRRGRQRRPSAMADPDSLHDESRHASPPPPPPNDWMRGWAQVHVSPARSPRWRRDAAIYKYNKVFPTTRETQSVHIHASHRRGRQRRPSAMADPDSLHDESRHAD
jgi:hypothetical protein